jgi:hypothetical protein
MLALQSLPQQQQQLYHQPPAQRPNSQMQRTPSPLPPQQATEDGTPVLFYGEFIERHSLPFILSHSSDNSVRALYDYAATIDEEFDFQAADIIAVTSTPEDGWWTGELLDEARRQRGRNVFPSNFVTFF